MAVFLGRKKNARILGLGCRLESSGDLDKMPVTYRAWFNWLGFGGWV
jgi:hypothetical protein